MKKLEVILVAILIATVSAMAGISSVTITTSETQVAGEWNDRGWCVLQNNGTNDCYVKWAPDATVVTPSNGVKLSANGGTITIMGNGGVNPIRNPIKAVTATGSATISYQEGATK